MSEEARNVAILTDAYRRWAESKGASADHWISIFDQTIRFGSIAEPLKTVAYMASYRSRDELGQYFAGIARLGDDRVPRRSFRRTGRPCRHARALQLAAKQSGKVVSTPKVDSWRFSDGKAVEFYEYFDTAQVAQAIAPA